MTTKSSESHHTLSWKKFECELCEKYYTYCFEYKGKIWSLVDF